MVRLVHNKRSNRALPLLARAIKRYLSHYETTLYRLFKEPLHRRHKGGAKAAQRRCILQGTWVDSYIVSKGWNL
jgi:hypothetical protein